MGEKSICVNKAANELHLSVLYCIDAALWVSVFMEEVLKHKESAPSLWTFIFIIWAWLKSFSTWIVLGVQLCFIPFLSMYLWHTELECLHRWERATRSEWEIESCHPTFVLPILWTELVGALSSCKTRPMHSSCAICCVWAVHCFDTGGFLGISLSPV